MTGSSDHEKQVGSKHLKGAHGLMWAMVKKKTKQKKTNESIAFVSSFSLDSTLFS
jgi:hypothetical protein